MYTLKNYLSLASNIFEYPNFLVLRYARTRPLNGKFFLTRILDKLYPKLVLKSETFKGLKLVIDPADFSHLKITDEFFFENIYNLTNLPFNPKAIIDCGAHIGMFTLLSKGYFPLTPLFIFEPNQENISFIKQQLKLNKIETATIEEAAVSTFDGVSSFTCGEMSFGGHLSNNKSEVKVKVIDLVRYIKNLSIKKLLIKIDIEGEEEKLIPLLVDSLPEDCILFFEYHFGIEKFNQIEKLLVKKNFEVKINRIVDELYIDALAIRTKN